MQHILLPVWSVLLGVIALGLWVGSLLPVHAQEDPSGDPQQVVASLHAALIGVMKEAGTLGYEGRKERLQPVITRTHDLKRMARYALGRNWRQLGAEERDRFLDLFTRLTNATYAHRFNGYKGQSFRQVEVRTLASQRVYVKTILTKPDDGKRVEMNYALKKRDGRWQIVNIFANGVSHLAIMRTEYASVIRREGFPTLIEKLEAKIMEIAN